MNFVAVGADGLSDRLEIDRLRLQQHRDNFAIAFAQSIHVNTPFARLSAHPRIGSLVVTPIKGSFS